VATTNWAVPVVRTVHTQCHLRAGDRTGSAGDHLCQAPISLSPTAACPPPVCVLGRYTRKELRESLQASKLVWVYIAIVVLLSAGLVAAVVFGVRWHRRNLAMHVMLAKHAERCGTVMGCMGDRKGTHAGLMWLRWPGSAHVCILMTDWAPRFLMARCHNSTYTHKHTHTQTVACALSDPCVGSTRAHRWIIGYVCHELRNPLHILKAAVSSLLERAVDSRPNSAQGGARSTGAGPLAVLSPGGGGGDVGTAPLVGTGPLPARPKLSPLQRSVASPPVPMKPSMSRGLRCVFSASGIALWLLRVGHATQGPSQVPQPRCPSLTTSASHSVTMTLSLVVHGSRFPPLCSVVSISVAFVCKQWWWGGPHPSPTQHRHWVRLHQLPGLHK
jgi:hypothetical protein